MTESIQRSFTSGEISPSLAARADLNKYQTGLDRLLNGFVHPEGGVSNRAGYHFTGYTRTNAALTRLVPFQFNTEQTYILVMTVGKMQVIKDGAWVLDPEMGLENVTADAEGVFTVTNHALVNNDEIVLTNFSVFLDNAKFIVEYVSANTFKLKWHRDGTYLNTFEYFTSDQVATGGSVATGGGSTNIIDTGATFTAALIGKYGRNINDNELFKVTAIVSPTEITIEEVIVGGITQDLNGKNYEFIVGLMQPVFSADHPYNSTEIKQVRWVQSADIMTMVHRNHPPQEISRTDHNAWTIAPVDFDAQITPTTISGTISISGDAGGVTATKTYEYVVTAVDAFGNESVASVAKNVNAIAMSTTRHATIGITAHADAASFNVYKAQSEGSGVYGYIGTTKFSGAAAFKDYNTAPDIGDSPPIDRNPFDGVGKYPSTVTYYQQRILYGGSIDKPETIDISRTANYHSMRTSVPSKDDDSITFTIASQQVNEVRHILAVGALLVLTSGGEWKVTEGQNQVLTPSTVSVKIQSYYGAADVSPVIIGHTALYVQESGSRLRDIGYTFESDSYTGSDLSIMAQHLFKNKSIVDMAFAQEPFRMVWAVRNDGVLLGLTYHREHKVTGWSQHTTDGKFLSVAVIREGQENILYANIERVIDGNTVYTVERLKERNWEVAADAYVMDCGLTYDGVPTETIVGLNHLANKEVIILADGNVVRGVTVNSRGGITLPNAASKIHIGISYISDVKTLNIDSAQRMVKGKEKSIGEAVIVFHETRGGWAGTEEEFLQEIKPRFQSDNYDSMELQSYEERVALDSGWTTGGQVLFRQYDPLPFTILAISPDVSIG